MGTEPLAHSAPRPGAAAQTYRAHIAGTVESDGVARGAERHAAAMLRYFRGAASSDGIATAIVDAATFHDMGKLDPENQDALNQGRKAKLRWDHVDAGVAHLSAARAMTSAWIVRAHHAPGLPSHAAHFTRAADRHLRGCRDDGAESERHQQQIKRTDDFLTRMLALHDAAVGFRPPSSGKTLHGLIMRLGLSCMVDADHGDTAWSDNGWTAPEPPAPRWEERLARLDAYVNSLGRGSQRDELRGAFYDACRTRAPDQALMACEGPVGIGKTTAVTAYLLRRAMATGARRLFIVAPYTAILSQTAKCLREALVLDDERADTIIAEHHHRADFGDISSRDLATLWTAPIILTTAVQFFETLSSNLPSSLRKLHALPGSVVFFDEAHAALPTPLWPQNWRWIRELAEDWTCSFVFASGSLARFWEVDDIVGDKKLKLPELGRPDLVAPLRQAENLRVHYVSDGKLPDREALAKAVIRADGPRLLIMNTVQSAAVMARFMREMKHDVLHLSTALAPRDRDVIFAEIKNRLHPKSGYAADWTLVATSLMEAGVDVSFRTAFRERFATASLIQIGGRANRNSEWPEGTAVHDFMVNRGDGLSLHPGASVSADVLADFFDENRLTGTFDPAKLVTDAMRREIKASAGKTNQLQAAEAARDYPDVAKLGRVIVADTCLVVIDRVLRDRIAAHERIPARELLSGSVQIWASKMDELGLEPLPGRKEVFWWPHAYDANFLGYMEGALRLKGIADGEPFIC